jgi:murein DD-endopeptidase MepM/ murein hydrolase activator NlpD
MLQILGLKRVVYFQFVFLFFVLSCSRSNPTKDNEFVEIKSQISLETQKEKCIKFLAGMSIYDSIEKKTTHKMLKNQFFEIFKDKVNFQNLDSATKVSIYYQTIPLASKDSVHILGAALLNAKEVKIAFWFEKAHEYFDEEGHSMKGNFLAMPIAFGRITSQFSHARFHPIEKVIKPHLGIDFAAPIGTPVLAAADGVLIEKSQNSGNGLYLKIKHSEAFITQYLHLSRFSEISVGRKVQKGEIVGYVGQTGLATGPHLCYRLWEKGRQVNPMKATNTHLFKLNNDNFVAFLQTNKKIREILF